MKKPLSQINIGDIVKYNPFPYSYNSFSVCSVLTAKSEEHKTFMTEKGGWYGEEGIEDVLERKELGYEGENCIVLDFNEKEIFFEKIVFFKKDRIK